jgi:glycosyltransferase involved in cell wall biosynthesis
MPTVSIILPSYNRRRFLEAAVESVFAQTYTAWELIIADDGSDEDTRAYLRTLNQPRVQTLWLEHCGNPSRVRNAAIRAARGRYLAFLDSDDIFAHSKLEKQVRALEESASARWCYTLESFIDEAGRPYERAAFRTFPPREGWVFEQLLKLELAMSMATVVARRDLVLEIGGFDEQLRFGEWHDLCLRLAGRSEVVAVREPLCSVRRHDEHYSADRISGQRAWLQLYRKMADTVTTPKLRAYCMKMCAETSLRIAHLQSAQGRHREGVATLMQALPFSWQVPRWWWRSLKQLVGPAVPACVRAALRRPPSTPG